MKSWRFFFLLLLCAFSGAGARAEHSIGSTIESATTHDRLSLICVSEPCTKVKWQYFDSEKQTYELSKFTYQLDASSNTLREAFRSLAWGLDRKSKNLLDFENNEFAKNALQTVVDNLIRYGHRNLNRYDAHTDAIPYRKNYNGQHSYFFGLFKVYRNVEGYRKIKEVEEKKVKDPWTTGRPMLRKVGWNWSASSTLVKEKSFQKIVKAIQDLP